MSLNPNAKPFSFNPGASVFTPGQPVARTTAPAPAAPAAPPAPSAPPPSESWEDISSPTAAAAAAPAPPAAPAAPAPALAAPAAKPEKKPAPEPKVDDTEPMSESMVALAIDADKMKALQLNPKKEAPAEDAEMGEGEEYEEADDEFLNPEERLRRHLNLVFIGHVDAGKSTTSGQILYQTGMVDERTMEKFEREAKAKNRESWKFAWAMDTTDTERAKGKTEEYGRGHFKTENKSYTILDAPGHKNFVPHMIGGASQADVGILIISTRKGEFEAGFEKGGQTREHALLAKTVGVRQLVVGINKMDDPTVCNPDGTWSKDRYDEVVGKLQPYLKQVGWRDADTYYMPISGLTGINIRERVPPEVCSWWKGPSLLEFLDNLKPPERLVDAPLRIPINNKYRDMGTVVMGKIEAGTVRKGQNLLLMPNKVPVEVITIHIESHEINLGEPGDNVKLKLKGVEEEDVRVGFVVASLERPVPYVRLFEAQVVILEYKSIICAGYQAVIHIHSAVEECVLEELIAIVDKKTGKAIQKKPKFVRPGQTCLAKFSFQQPICVEKYKDFAQLGRFMIRDEGKTVGVGVITEVYPAGDSLRPGASGQ